MENLREKFLNLTNIDSFQRVIADHPVPWYIGLDTMSRYSLFCIINTMPKALASTKFINVFIGRRKDDSFGITFSLKEKKAFDMFVHFCDDMLESSMNITQKENIADFICARYIAWQSAFAKTNGDKLSAEQIKGLIGEMYFLTSKMIPMYGAEKALNCWSGTEATDQDFNCDDTWYEVKSTVSGSPSVKISSVEQLDAEREGHLVVIYLDKTSEGDSGRITLNSMYKLIMGLLKSPVLQQNFAVRMINFGYIPDDYYEEHGYRYNGMHRYRVDSTFPCIRNNQIPAAALHTKYELSLSAIAEFKEA